jgi:hypothetical protein
VRANEITEIFVEQIEERERQLRQNHRWVRPALNRMAKGKAIDLDLPWPDGLNPRDRAIIVDMASHAGIYRLWARNGRVTFDVNPHLAEELYRSTYDRLPGDIFSHLPYINPLVVLPEPWPINWPNPQRKTSPDWGLVRGFYVHGFNRDPDQMTLTTDEDLFGLGILYVIDLIDDATGEVRGQTYMRLGVPLGLDEFTFEEAVDFAGGCVEAMYIGHSPQFNDYLWDVVQQLLRPTLSLLIYFCCDNRDAVEAPVAEPVRGKRQRVTTERDHFWVEIGWRMGPQLHAARRSVGRTPDGPSTPTGVQRAPHQRAGHFHKYRIGPGRPNERTQLITRWVMPTWVNLGELPEDADPLTTVVTVDPQRHDPLRSRGIKRANLGTTKAKEITDRERQRTREDRWDW